MKPQKPVKIAVVVPLTTQVFEVLEKSFEQKVGLKIKLAKLFHF